MEEREILEKLLEAKLITEDQITEIFGVSDTLKQLADSMHLFLCERHHDIDCDYIQEDVFDDTWNGVAHKDWIRKAQDFMHTNHLTETEALNAVSLAANTINNHKRPTLTFIHDYIKACQVRELLPHALPASLPEHEPSSPSSGEGQSSSDPSDSDKPQ